MWLVEEFSSLFTLQLPILNLCLFRLLFGLACLVKFFIESKRGYLHYFDPEKYLFFCYHFRNQRPEISSLHYKIFYTLKILAALLLMLGLVPQVAAFFLGLWFLLESRIYFKFHVNYFCLCSFILSLSSDLSSALTLSSFTNALLFGPQVLLCGADALGDAWPTLLIVATTSAMYLSTAVRKLRSKPFLDGTVIIDTLKFLQEEAPRRKYKDGWYPQWFLQAAVLPKEAQLKPYWSIFMILTIVLEIIVPFLLLSPNLYWLGAFLGAAMHLGFTAVYPITLTHFSLATVASYLLFIDPRILLTLAIPAISGC